MLYSIVMKTVLLFRTSFHPQMRLTYEPFFDFARTHGWNVQTIEHMNAAVSRYWSDSTPPTPNIREIVDLWQPDGCIVECGGIPDEPWNKEFKSIPTVFLDRPQHPTNDNDICVTDDPKSVAMLAAKELLSLGLDNYAFVGFHEPLPWSEARGRYFIETISNHGKECCSLRMPKSTNRTAGSHTLDSFLQGLPKPCGLFAANDETAARIVNACRRLGIEIPNELAIVSVDNDIEICEHLPVTLTSIELDHADAVRKAVALLDALMESKPIESQTFGVKRIVRRASANGIRNLDIRVSKAMEFIRRNACNPITTADVVKQMGCSVRLANLRFGQIRHHTILDEIHLRRLETAKDLFGNPETPISTIAHICGYASATDFGRVFKRYNGKSPREWKKTTNVQPT